MASLSFLIALLAAFWVYKDAKSRGQSKNTALLWAVGTLAMLIVFLPLYLLFGRRKPEMRRNDEKTIDVEATVIEDSISCPMCASKVKDDFKVCPYCSYTLQPKCEQCGHELKREWKACPNCQTPNSNK
ncbi:double zinc ribbon domain-containing protein [Dendrosporobacter sp. 1207_IL3150]|uniref:double zinc ribbon domain-containing protein n=1 Tax=Dendrosporobacter sp. 1207_IL3150 TaxID=3084054 RepID=UPI002FD9D78C